MPRAWQRRTVEGPAYLKLIAWQRDVPPQDPQDSVDAIQRLSAYASHVAGAKQKRNQRGCHVCNYSCKAERHHEGKLPQAMQRRSRIHGPLLPKESSQRCPLGGFVQTQGRCCDNLASLWVSFQTLRASACLQLKHFPRVLWDIHIWEMLKRDKLSWICIVPSCVNFEKAGSGWIHR